jgi:hypothetical protein
MQAKYNQLYKFKNGKSKIGLSIVAKITSQFGYSRSDAKIWQSRLLCLFHGHIPDEGCPAEPVFTKSKKRYRQCGEVLECKRCGKTYVKFNFNFDLSRLIGATLRDLPVASFDTAYSGQYYRFSDIYKNKGVK